MAVASEEMAATSDEIANSCVKAAESSTQASTSAVTGAEVVDRTISVMNRIARGYTDEDFKSLAEFFRNR